MNQDFHSPETVTILVVDDHPLILGGTLDILRKHYSEASVIEAKTAVDALDQVQSHPPDLVVIDLSIPEQEGLTAQIETGMEFLRQLMAAYPTLNLMVQSSYIKSLIRIKHDIDSHQGGFTVADKGLATPELLTRANWALAGVTHTKDLSLDLAVKPEWLEVLRLAFKEGLTDRAIAQQMHVSERTVRHYWTKIQDVLAIYPDESKQAGKNIRIQTQICAREAGLID